ncbi:hypothetical protein EDD86DRAFT_217677 [Gorgonomyces haynaldii]|nr:hypothetical protein EDD86DRAFT_217677 [Gorgonomyces haynaldii]
MDKIKRIEKLNELELEKGLTNTASWHDDYKDTAWIYVGGLDFELTEGDIICIFSQFGEITDCVLVRDKQDGRSKGFAFVCYENQKSTILAVDNFNGAKVLGRQLSVNHARYKHGDEDQKDVEDRRAKIQTVAEKRDRRDLEDPMFDYLQKKHKKDKKKKKKKE